ncbi:MAG: NlpC/P60 family protein [Verrucomicrobiae bacterium]|nr:NlpC/P60 family protein [Verrucomicrobiae bacterium]
MSKPFFNTPESIRLLDMEAHDWVGTPFAPRGRLKHVGVDCVGLVAGIYVAMGVIKKFEPGPYALDEGQHAKTSKVEAWFSGRREFEKCSAGVPPAPGDTLIFNLARVGHHVGLVLENRDVIHAMYRRIAMVSSLDESFYASAIVGIYRPLQPEGTMACCRSSAGGRAT